MTFEKHSTEHPEKVYLCPLQHDDLKLFRSSSSNKFDFEKIQPDGDYRYEHKYWTDDDENIYTNTVNEMFKTAEDAFF